MTSTSPSSRIRSVLLKLLLWPAERIERAKGWRKFAILALELVIVVGGVGLIAWSTQLRGLPDVGDPFDIAEFTMLELPDEENAFVLYRQAGELLVAPEWSEEDYPNGKPLGFGTQWRWSKAAPPFRSWLEANSLALETWKAGTNRPQALLIPPAEANFSSQIEPAAQLIELGRLAVLKATRFEEHGEMTKAWEWYQAALRSGLHAGENGFLVQKIFGESIQSLAINELTTWAEDSRTDIETLYQALQEIKRLRNLIPKNSEPWKLEYLALLKALESPAPYLGHHSRNNQNSHEWYLQDFVSPKVNLILRRDPERSRRVVRLYFSMLLDHVDLPHDQHMVWQQLESGTSYPPPSKNQPISTEELDGWLQSTILARTFLPAGQNLHSIMDRQRAQLDMILVHIAEILYVKEHGNPPDRYEDLVGPYLDELPVGYRDMFVPNQDEEIPSESLGSRDSSRPNLNRDFVLEVY